jgi:triphosphatase
MAERGLETEIKLAGSPATLRRLAADSILSAAGPARRERLDATYFDTPTLDLWKAGYALRIRREGRRYVQTVKGGAPATGGLHERMEIESQVAGREIEREMFDDARLREVFTTAIVDALVPVYETRVVRVSRLLVDATGAAIDVSLDQGKVCCGGRSAPLCEVELELKTGSRAALFDLARDLLTLFPLRLENRSKAERGISLALGEPPVPRRARAVRLGRDSSVGEAYRTIIGSSLAHLQSNDAGVAPGADPEYVHQMRVALRRMRAAYGLFRPIIPVSVYEMHAGEMKWLARSLGPAREWDVFVTETLPPVVAAFSASRVFEPLLPAFDRLRRQANERARRAVQSRRYQQLVLDLARWESGGAGWILLDAAGVAIALRGITDYAGSVLERRWRTAVKRGRHMDSLSAEALHEFRIAAKKLRYAYDFFKELFDADDLSPMLSALTRVQDITGAVNDAETVARLLAHARRLTSIKEDAEAAGILLGWSQGRAHALRTRLGKDWKSVRRLKHPG